MPAGTYAAQRGEVRATLTAAMDGDQAAMATVCQWNGEVRASVSEGFCPSCDGPLDTGLMCYGDGPGPGHGHGVIKWDAGGYAEEIT